MSRVVKQKRKNEFQTAWTEPVKLTNTESAAESEPRSQLISSDIAITDAGDRYLGDRNAIISEQSL